MMSEKEVVANEVAAPAVESAPAKEEAKYVDPRVGYVPLSKHARKVLAKRRAKNKARRIAARKNRK